MAYLLCEAHFWTLKQQTIIPDDNIGCFAYHQKNDLDANNHSYNDEKVQYTEGRDVTWRPRNKRPVRLREALQEVEELLGSKTCVGLCWLSRRLLQIYLSNGTVVTCNVSTFTGDVDCLHIDKSLVNKLSVENASAVILSNAYMMLAYSDRAKVDYVAFLKQPQPGKRIDKLSSLDPRVMTVDIPGPSARKLERRFVSNQQQSLVVCWWSFGQVEVMPWTPVTGDREKANLVLLSVGSFRPETVCYARTAGDLVSVQFSQIQSQQIHTVEQATTSSNEFTAYICVYECDQKKLQRLSAISIPLQTSVTCTDRCSTEDHVLLGCSDGSIVLYDSYRKVTQSAKCTVVPSFVSWHPSGCIFIVISSRGDFQMFDVALSPLHIQLVSSDLRPSPTISLSTFLKSLPTLCQAVWNPQLPNAEYALVECNDLLSLVFDRGPVVMMSFYFGVMNQGLLSALQLVNQYIRTRQLSEAIDVLSTLNWNSDSRTSFACLSTIINHLLKLPLDPVTEDRIQETLGLFYSPAKPLTEATILRYRDAVGHLARRFFHVLLRYSRFEKAFLLAVDIGARDLFMDIHFAARDRGETVLAQVARQKADQLEAESLTEEGSLQYGHSEESLNSLEEHYNSDDQLDIRITDDTLDQELQFANSLDVRFQSKRPQLPLGDMQGRSQRYLEDGILGSLEASLSSALKDEFTDCFLPNKTQASSSSQGEMLKSERERLRKVISEAVLLLCKNSCMVESLKVSIEGIIGITLGEEDVILVSFKEEVKTETDAQNAQEKNRTSHELVAVKRAESDETGRRLLTRRSKDCAIAKMTQAIESVEISETEESGSNRKPAKRKRVDSRSEENQKSRTSNQDSAEPVRSLDKEPESKKPASDQSLDVTAKPYSNAWVKSEISNILSEHLTESNEFSVEPSSMHTESTVARETTSDDSVASDIPKNQPDITEYDEALSSILKLPSELDDDATAADVSNPNIVVKCEDKGADDDCVFVKSEIFEVTDNQTFDMQITGEEEFFGEGSVPFPESGPVMQSVDQLPSSKSRYIEYIQRGCVVQASTSQTVYTHITEDPDTYSFGSGKHDASLECHICKTVLKSRQTLNDHIQGTHLSRYRYKCTFCGLGFKWRSMLSYHKRACPALAKPGFC